MHISTKAQTNDRARRYQTLQKTVQVAWVTWFSSKMRVFFKQNANFFFT